MCFFMHYIKLIKGYWKLKASLRGFSLFVIQHSEHRGTPASPHHALITFLSQPIRGGEDAPQHYKTNVDSEEEAGMKDNRNLHKDHASRCSYSLLIFSYT